MTYCFRVINSGETALANVAIDDATLGITSADLTLVSGDETAPLPIGGELVYSYETTADAALTNVALMPPVVVLNVTSWPAPDAATS